MSANKRSLSQTLDCQTLIRRGAFSSRGTIPANFTPAQPPDLNYIFMKSQSHYETWLTTRYFSNKVGEIENIPSFLNMNSFLHDTVQQKQKSHLLLFNRALQQSMIPSILLCVIFKMFFFRCPSQMVHFGAMKVCIGWQRNSSFWNLHALTTYFWVKGVSYGQSYIACCGEYLEDTGIDSILVENEVYGPENVKHVINGGHYVRGIRGMAIISEVLHSLLLELD